MIPALRRRDDGSYPEGGVFYKCNYFRGCCTIDPCMPGSTCPADEDRTPGRSSDAPSSTLIASISITSITSMTSSMVSRTTSGPALDTGFTISLEKPSLKTVTQSPSAIATSSTNAPVPADHAQSSIIAPVVGAVLGTVILCALLASILLYLRRRRRTKVYKAASYPSPLVGDDMTSQLSSKPMCYALVFGTRYYLKSGKASTQFQQKIAALYRADSITKPENPPQLGSREIGQHELHRNASMARLSELPAEPIPWPGHAAHG
ncbi:hypothetical protein BKA58DRAFT_394381 [Alternaria rosae]|uniref:uncharacterized protein n=1 Tax=Alternaria rosae TaxID=1187941 RepID=UPI001E8EA7C4|nr:uncharacterized protein BKA58DRAFT_394381 [Alternaria rosae]KAH6852865.1 hypothetical protein BKA58DRAFT_394381 [Alternaria rosae]